MDTTTGLAAQMAYQFLFTLAPGLLFLWHLLSLFGTDPAKLHQMINVLKNFLPADPKVQEIIDSLVANIVVTGSSGALANVGIFFGLWLGTIFISTTSHALSRTHGVVEDRNWWSKYIIAFFLVFWFGITTLFCFNAMVFGETLAGDRRSEFSTDHSASGMGRVPQPAADGARSRRSRPRALSPHAGELFYRSGRRCLARFSSRSAGSW